MIRTSRLFDLRVSGLSWEVTGDGLHDNLVTPSGESLEGISLPNASLCADFLLGDLNVWAGITVEVGKDDLPTIREWFQLATPALAKLILPEQAAKIQRYEEYEGCGWLEVIWYSAQTLQLNRVLTNGVLWYASNPSKNTDKRIVVMGLEDLASLMHEAGRTLIIPEAFSRGK